MPTRLGLTLLLALVAFSGHVSANTANAASSSRYVVVLERSAGDPATVAAQHSGRYGLQVGDLYRAALRGYSTSKGTVRFPLDKPIPTTLVRRLVRARVKDVLAKNS